MTQKSNQLIQQVNPERSLTAVILAGGLGTRLGELTVRRPKALVTVASKPIVQYSLAWAKRVGATKRVVVGGYRFSQLAEAVAAIDPLAVTVEHEEYAVTRRMAGLLAAANAIEGDLLVFDGDYLYQRAVAEKVRANLDGVTIFVTSDNTGEVQLDMKVRVDESGHLLAMSKELAGDWQYYFNSLLYCGAEFIPDFFAKARETIKQKGVDQVHIEDALLTYAASGGRVKAVDAGYPRWVEIDTPEELAAAEAMVRRSPQAFDTY